MSHRRHTEHNARTTGGTNSGIRDIGLFIKNYNNLSDKLYPVFAVWEIILYVTRYCRKCCVWIYNKQSFCSHQMGELLINTGCDTGL